MAYTMWMYFIVGLIVYLLWTRYTRASRRTERLVCIVCGPGAWIGMMIIYAVMIVYLIHKNAHGGGDDE